MESVVSTAYWPPIPWFAVLLGAGTWRLEAWEHYCKQTARTRCRIVGANGVQDLIIPVIRRHGTKTPIKEVRIDYSRRWQPQHWGAMVAAYRSSAFFEYYAAEMEAFYTRRDWEFLFDYNGAILALCQKMLGLRPGWSCTEAYTGLVCEKKWEQPTEKAVPYYQVFLQKHGFVPYLSIVDLLCNEGPNALCILKAEADAQQQVQAAGL